MRSHRTRLCLFSAPASLEHSLQLPSNLIVQYGCGGSSHHPFIADSKEEDERKGRKGTILSFKESSQKSFMILPFTYHCPNFNHRTGITWLQDRLGNVIFQLVSFPLIRILLLRKRRKGYGMASYSACLRGARGCSSSCCVPYIPELLLRLKSLGEGETQRALLICVKDWSGMEGLFFEKDSISRRNCKPLLARKDDVS